MGELVNNKHVSPVRVKKIVKKTDRPHPGRQCDLSLSVKATDSLYCQPICADEGKSVNNTNVAVY